MSTLPDTISGEETSEPQSQAASRASGKAKKRKTGVLADRMIVPMRLGDIKGEHGLVMDLDRQLQLPYLPQPRSGCVSKKIILTLLERTPLLICQEQKDRDVCIGNVRLYRLACFRLDANELVPTIRYSESMTPSHRKQQLREGLLLETFLMPAIFGRRAAELEALSAAWEKATAVGLLEFWVGPKSLAELFREDPGQLKRKRARHRG